MNIYLKTSINNNNYKTNAVIFIGYIFNDL